MKQKINLPKKDAGRRLADRLEKIAQREPPQALIDKINQKEAPKKVASSKNKILDMDV